MGLGFELLDDSDTRLRLVLTAPDGLPLTWHLRTELGAGPLALLTLRGFTLPKQIFSGGGLGRRALCLGRRYLAKGARPKRQKALRGAEAPLKVLLLALFLLLRGGLLLFLATVTLYRVSCDPHPGSRANVFF
ncbi:ImcF domain-containing protein [Pseudomonas sp. M47T1]|nr:ImcF domain-containing protein [Pseudomonas sp. M47T1]